VFPGLQFMRPSKNASTRLKALACKKRGSGLAHSFAIISHSMCMQSASPGAVPRASTVHYLHRTPFVAALQVASITALRPKASHRRPHNPELDGPFPVQPGDSSLRVKQIARSLVVPGSGLDPGHYDGPLSKDACMRNTCTGARIGKGVRGGVRPVLHYAVSTSAALAHGHTWVDTALHGPLDVSHFGTQVAADTRSQWEDATLRMPRVAEGHALDTLTHRVCRQAGSQLETGQAQASVGDRRTQEQGASQRMGEVAIQQPGASGTEQDLLTKSRAPSSRQAQPVATSMPRDKHRFLPQKPPPPEVARSAVRGSAPGEWEWGAVSRSLCNTFTMQDGGAFRNDRAKAQPCGGRLSCDRSAVQALTTPAALPSRQAVPSEQIHPDSPMCLGMVSIPEEHAAHCNIWPATEGSEAQGASLGQSVNSTQKCVNHKEVTEDLMVHESRTFARRAAEEAQAVRTRQKRWKVQSALLPFLKREAALRDSAMIGAS
jgi:hypothetical protein